MGLFYGVAVVSALALHVVSLDSPNGGDIRIAEGTASTRPVPHRLDTVNDLRRNHGHPKRVRRPFKCIQIELVEHIASAGRVPAPHGQQLE